MLVLSRKKSEKIVVTGPCEIEVSKLSGSRVVLGFTATDGVKILRAELMEKARDGRETDE